MSPSFVRNLILTSCLLAGIAPAPGLAEVTVQTPESAPTLFPSGGCTDSILGATSMPDQGPNLSVLEPEKTWTSANPCFVSCPNGGFIDCTWSWAGDPHYCCWKSATRCQSYNCSSGSIVLSKVCLGF